MGFSASRDAANACTDDLAKAKAAQEACKNDATHVAQKCDEKMARAIDVEGGVAFLIPLFNSNGSIALVTRTDHVLCPGSKGRIEWCERSAATHAYRKRGAAAAPDKKCSNTRTTWTRC